MKLVTYVTAGTNIKNNLKCIEIEYNDGTIDYFTLEIDPVTNRRKNFRTKEGKLFARTTKSFKKNLGFSQGSHNSCAVHTAMNKEWGLCS